MTDGVRMLDRLEAATGFNKSLMWDVCKELGVSLDTPYPHGPTTLGILIDARAWTSAAEVIVDAAMPDFQQSSTINRWGGAGQAFASLRAQDGIINVDHKTVALALITALFRARAGVKT